VAIPPFQRSSWNHAGTPGAGRSAPGDCRGLFSDSEGRLWAQP